jgi:hypothetical protein
MGCKIYVKEAVGYEFNLTWFFEKEQEVERYK